MRWSAPAHRTAWFQRALTAPVSHAAHHNDGVQLVPDVIPFAIGVFASPLPVIIAILMLFAPHPHRISGIYIATWTSGVVLATLVFTGLAGLLEEQDGSGWGAWVKVVLGVLLIAAAIKGWLGRSATESPSWLSTVMNAEPRQAVKLGVLLSVANPKELLMAAGAGIALGTSQQPLTTQAVAFVVFIVIGASSVFGPLLIFVAGGDASLRGLEKAREWLERNSVAVASGVLGVIGLFLLLSGLPKVV